MEEARLAERPSLTLERFYPVAPERVWRARTEPRALKRWFCGRFRILFGGARGTEHAVQGVYREVVPHRRLAERESPVTIELRKAGRGTEMNAICRRAET